MHPDKRDKHGGARLILLAALLVGARAVPPSAGRHDLADASPQETRLPPPSTSAPEGLGHSLASAGAYVAAVAARAHGTAVGAVDWARSIHKWTFAQAPASQPMAADICTDSDWRKTSLKLVRQLPVAGLFEDLKGTSKWEASGMDVVNGNQAFMIFDSLDYIGGYLPN